MATMQVGRDTVDQTTQLRLYSKINGSFQQRSDMTWLMLITTNVASVWRKTPKLKAATVV